jgi:hypothetical protein
MVLRMCNEWYASSYFSYHLTDILVQYIVTTVTQN